MVEGFVAGSIFGVAVGLLLSRIWRDSARTFARSAPLDVPPGSKVPPDPAAPDPHGRILGRRVVRRKIETKLTPDGLTITMDGQEFHHLEEIPDRALRDEVRTLLASTAASLTDSAARAKVEQELRDVGIETSARDHPETLA